MAKMNPVRKRMMQAQTMKTMKLMILFGMMTVK